jgi:hypothetical protein
MVLRWQSDVRIKVKILYVILSTVNMTALIQHNCFLEKEERKSIFKTYLKLKRLKSL